MGKNSRDRHKAKRKAEQRRTATQARFGGPSPLQVAEEIIYGAVDALHRKKLADLKRCRALLVEGPGGADGIQVVNRAFFTVLERGISEVWQRGWQPAELVRLARREHTVRHGRLAVDAIAAQLRTYAAATVDPRWQSQLSALDASVWWEHDDLYVDVWAEQQGLDRATAINHLLDLLGLVWTLPTVDTMGPLPGSAPSTAAATAAMRSDVDQRMLDRVRALLAKAESTDFPEEAETYTAKAQQLMARHSIDHVLLSARIGGHDEPVTRRIGVDNPYEAPKTLLLQVIAEANHCRAVWSKTFGFTTVVGFPADLDSVELLFTSLLVQATRAMTQVSARPDRYGRNTTRSFRQSFLSAYADRIGQRLATATEDVGREMAETVGGGNLLPVLAARSDAVRDAFEERFPDLTSHVTQISNREGWVSGLAAADLASLHGRQSVSG